LGNLPHNSANITQTSYDTLANNTVTLEFNTNNLLPAGTSILVGVPKTLPQLYYEPNSCYLKIENKRYDDVCTFNDYDITYSGAFANYTSFNGTIQLFFKVQNPANNSEISSQAFTITIFDSEEKLYGIDILEGVLYPNIDCDYPCKTCRTSDRRYCESCL
jgi:hypothetical protein